MALPGQRLNQIQGNMPALNNHPSGCAFHPRCPYATDKCRENTPGFVFSGVSTVACFAIEDMLAEFDPEGGWQGRLRMSNPLIDIRGLEKAYRTRSEWRLPSWLRRLLRRKSDTVNQDRIYA